MGIDIYLNGFEEYQSRIAEEKAAFDAAARLRDSFERDSTEHKEAQALVETAADAMWSGAVGYLRSSYNGSGLFRVLEEIYGFDIAEYFFPGDWDAKPEVPIDGIEFVGKVVQLQRTAALALARSRMRLPWIDIYTEVTGEAAPDGNEAHARGEAFGDKVFADFAGLGFDHVDGGPRDPSPVLLGERHGWYLTEGLKNLLEFGRLARRLNAEGKETFAYISY